MSEKLRNGEDLWEQKDWNRLENLKKLAQMKVQGNVKT